MSRFRARYGGSPLHLAAVVASFAVAGYAAAQIVESPSWPRIVLWFVLAAVAHDFVLFPLYTALDRLSRGRHVNYVRVPALLSLLFLLVSLPLVLEIAPGTYESASALRPEPYLERWLAITAALFAGSGLVYGVRRFRDGRPGGRPRRTGARR